jgi:PhnB protein
MSKVDVHPYLFFKGTCLEAMEFYQSVFGGELQKVTFEALGMEAPAEFKNGLMHAFLTGGDIELMAMTQRKPATPPPK